MYINLKISNITSAAKRLDFLLERGLAPEIRLDAKALDQIPPHTHDKLAKRLARAGLRPSIHLPHDDLLPGAGDETVRRASAKRLIQAVELAKRYDPAILIAHTNLLMGLAGGGPKMWVKSSARTWHEVLATWPNHPPLYVENVFEPSPSPLAALVDELDNPRVAACFDVGHWHAMAQGYRLQNLDHWLDVLGARIKHLHVHDNAGQDDEHLAPGNGRIDFDAFLGGLTRRGVNPGVTFEPHGHEELVRCLAFAAKHPWFGGKMARASELLAS